MVMSLLDWGLEPLIYPTHLHLRVERTNYPTTPGVMQLYVVLVAQDVYVVYDTPPVVVYDLICNHYHVYQQECVHERQDQAQCHNTIDHYLEHDFQIQIRLYVL